MSPPERTFGPIGWKGLSSDEDDDGTGGTDGPGGTDGSDRNERTASDSGNYGNDTEDRMAGSEGNGAGRGSESPDSTATDDGTVGAERSATGERITDGNGSGDAPSRSDAAGAIREERTDRLRDSSESDEAGRTDGPRGSRERDGEPSSSTAHRANRDDVGEQIRRARSSRAAELRDHGSGPASAETDDDPGDSGSSVDEDRSRAAERTAGRSKAVREEPTRRNAEDESGSDVESQSSTERTVGPIGLKSLSSGDRTADEGRAPETAEAAGTVTESNARTVDRRDRTTGESTTTEEEGLTGRLPWSVSLTAIGVGVGLLVFLDIVSMMVPLLAAIGGGIVAGFVAGYIAGGTIRGGLHALAVGIVGGVAVGYLTALIGALIGLFMEPATLLGNWIGPVTPQLGMFGDLGPVVLVVVVTVMVAIDATVAGVVGGTLRSAVDEAR